MIRLWGTKVADTTRQLHRVGRSRLMVEHQEAPAGALRVVIADADPESAALAEQTLAAAGYEVAMATSGPEALHYTDADAADLYLLDRDLPELDGERVARYL